jgi:hypothetical protein
LIGDVAVNLSSAGGAEESWRLRSIAITIAKAGNLDLAAIMARSIGFGPDRASALASVAQVAADEGRIDQARLLVIEAKEVIDSLEFDSRDWPLEALSRAIGSIGDIEQASVTASSIPHPSPQGSALASLTELIAKRGDLHRAESIARSIVEPHGRGQALTSLAQTVAEAGDSERARKILAETLTMASPLLALPVLATIDPSIIEITVQHFLVS